MTQTVRSSALPYDNSMSTQPGSLQDSNAYGLPPSSFTIGSDPEPDGQSREQYSNHHPNPSEMGLRYMTIPVSDDARYSSEATPLNAPVYSVEPQLTTSPTTTAPFYQQQSLFSPALSTSSHYSTPQPSYLPSSNSSFCLPDIKQSFAAFGGTLADMQPSARSPPLPQITSPISIRDQYSTNAPGFRRHSEILTRSPPGSMYGRAPMSPSSSSGFTSPLSLETAQLSNNPNGPPPLKPTELHYTITTSDGQSIRPEIIGKIDKGFFLAENDWTCYRRNYFQVTCSYTLNPSVPTGTTMLLNQSGSQVPIQHLAMSISAVVDGENGKKIDLVQHTPKRDKGPQLEIQRVVLLPRPVNTTLYNGGLGADGMRSDRLYDTNFAQAPNQPPTETTFERIQFKQATANNGKRRARQQYYHLIIELYADLGSSMGEGRWVKIARRVSAQMVVRGRSPGHYHVESRGANSSSGTGGASGQNGSMGSYGSPNGGMMDGRNGDSFVGGSNSMIGSGGYGGSYSTSRSSRYLASQGISIPPEPILTTEEEKAFTEAEGYRYYPHTLQDTSMSGMRAQLPPFQAHIDDRLPLNLGGYATSQPRLKQSYSNGYSLPSLTSPQLDAYNRNCGRFESVPSSRGYYPTAVVLSQINST